MVADRKMIRRKKRSCPKCGCDDFSPVPILESNITSNVSTYQCNHCNQRFKCMAEEIIEYIIWIED